MSKRNIRGKSGKQLYLNQLFLGGMKYTSSEMTEGVAKVISNFDISPTGDSAMPRTAFTSKKLSGDIGKYFYPVKFNQAINEQHYIEFVNTVSEDDYVNDVTDPLDTSYAPIKFYSRSIGDITEPTTTIEGSYESDPSGTEEDLEKLFSDCFEGVREYDPETFSNFESANESNYTVIDGDTFSVFADFITGDHSVRILGIDAPETKTNDNWSAMSTRMLKYIVDTYFVDRTVYYKEYGFDTYGRKLLDIYFPSDENQLMYLNLSELMVRCGLAKPAYFYDTYPIQNQLYAAFENAKNAGLCIHSDKVDPFLIISKNKLLENPEYRYSEYRYEFVKTTDTKAVNSLLSNKNDTVQFQYIDYLDSIGILGRILNSYGAIVYKGLMYIKPVISIGNLNFIIELPPNNLNGEEIDITKAQETGYNLLNKNIINLDDSYDEYLVAGIKGLAVTDLTNKNVVLEATRGQEVNLHAVMNYGITNHLVKPNVSFKLYSQIVKEFDTGKFEGFVDDSGKDWRNPITKKEVTNHIYNISNKGFSTTISPDTSSEHLLSFKIKFTKLEVVLYNGDQEVTINVSDQMTALIEEIYSEKLQYYFEAYDRDYPITVRTTFGSFEIKILKDTFSCSRYTLPWENNPPTVDQILFVDLEVTKIPTLDKFETEVVGIWEKAKYGADIEKDEGWSTISNENIYYTIESNILKLKEGSAEDISWVVDELNNISLRYTVRFYQYLKIGDTVFSDYPMSYKTSDIYLAMPLFKISHTPKFLDQDDITNNINIKDATRIGVFNRQLYLYGPYTKSNFIQFSMFEEQWYLPFPYYNIEIPEPIVYVYPFLDSLVVFGKYNIYMLTGGVGVLDLSLHKIYENLSITAADVNLVNTVGTSLMFFNNNIGYLIVPNTYSDDPTNIKVYKLTDNISNALLNPEPLIKAITNKVDLDNFATTIFANYTTFVDNNVLYIAANYTWSKETTEYKSCIIYRYNQTYKYWNLYYSPTFTELNNSYIAEPQLGVQYITADENVKRLTFLNSVHIDPVDKVYTNGVASEENIETYLDTGYLSVDTMNDKRFKDIIIEFDNIKRYKDDSKMEIKCNFFIDGTPMFISEPDNIQVENQHGESLGEIEPYIPLKDEYFNTSLHHISDSNRDSNNPLTIDSTYGVAFKLDDSMYTNVGRTHVRIPVFGKGRLPSFTLRIVTKNNYEFINYSLIYKEKNINRRR